MDLDLSDVESLLRDIHRELEAINREFSWIKQGSFAHQVIERLDAIESSIQNLQR